MLNQKSVYEIVLKAVLILTLVFPQHLFADEPDSEPYKFNWKKKNDMSGAFMVCGLTGFVLGECPKVLLKCMTDPALLRIKLFGVESKCLDLFNFLTSSEDVANTFEEAQSRGGEEVDEVNDVNLNDFSHHTDGVIASNTQDPEPEEPVGRGSYAGSIYDNAEVATENLINQDYYNFYYYGDGNGNGGWGAPNYKKGFFETSVFTGLSADEAYDEAFVNAYNNVYDDVYDATYEQVYNELIADVEIIVDEDTGEEMLDPAGVASAENGARVAAESQASLEANSAGIAAGNTAYHNQLAIIDTAYDNWRNTQPWSTFGYQRGSFEDDYNLERLSIYYNAYIAAANSCGLECAEAEATNALAGVPYTG